VGNALCAVVKTGRFHQWKMSSDKDKGGGIINLQCQTKTVQVRHPEVQVHAMDEVAEKEHTQKEKAKGVKLEARRGTAKFLYYFFTFKLWDILNPSTSSI
jgi:hypothetical protein